MSFKPTAVAIDYETSLITTGKGSVEFYRKDFRCDSMAYSYRDAAGELKNGFIEGEERIKLYLQKLADEQVPVWAHNLPFEMGVTQFRFPDIDINWGGDTMRLAQNYDNGGKEYGNDTPLTYEEELEKAMAELEGKEYERSNTYTKGLSLDACVRRILPKKFHGHKEEAHEWIRNHVKEFKKNDRPGRYLNRLPYDVLRRYNIGDTDNTLRLYEIITDHFEGIGFNWQRDHTLYLNSVRMIVESKGRGVPVNRDKIAETIAQKKEEIYQIEQEFKEMFSKEIAEVERRREEKWLAEPKTDRGREGRIKRLGRDRELSDPYERDKKNKYDEHVRFNVGSNKQLEMLFVDLLGMEAQFTTDKDNPSFKSCFLHQWGDGGMILGERRKKLLVLKQSQSLEVLTRYDGRWHTDLKACGTATGRYAGGTTA